MSSPKPWTVQFYEDVRGVAPALEFLESLSLKDRAALARTIDLLEEVGVGLRSPHAEPVDGDIWELKGGPGRVFYFAYRDRRFILLHGYRKKTRKAPRKEIETARRRLADFLERERAK